MTFLWRTLLLLAVLASGWMVGAVTAQSTQAGPWFREVNSALILQALGGSSPLSARADTFTGTGNGAAVDVSSAGRKWYGVQVKGTGAAATSWTVNLQASLDGTNYATILTHTNTVDSDGAIAWISTPAPALYFKSNVSAVTLGSATNIVVTIVGMP